VLSQYFKERLSGKARLTYLLT